jgi:hypothetical protein
MAEWVKHIGLSTLATPIPNFATAPYAQMINYESFTGRPVVTLAKEKLLPEMQYDQYTSETAKQLGRLIQAIPFVGDVANQIGPAGRKITSPMVLDMWIRETTGTMGQIGVTILDKALQKAGVSPTKIEPTPTLADYPIIREFVWRHPSMRAEDIVQFQERYAKASSVISSMRAKAAEAAFNPDAGMQVVDMQTKYADQMAKLEGPHEAIKNMAHQVQGLRLLPNMDPVQKRQLTDQYYYRMVKLAQDANRQMDEIEKVMKTTMGAKK